MVVRSARGARTRPWRSGTWRKSAQRIRSVDDLRSLTESADASTRSQGCHYRPSRNQTGSLRLPERASQGRWHTATIWQTVNPRSFGKICSASVKLVLTLAGSGARSEEHTSELQSRFDLVCRLL